MTPLHLGIDVGTQGVRAICVDDDGTVAARSSVPLEVPEPAGPQEQDPGGWWVGLRDAVLALGTARDAVRDIAISCTSGTLCLVDGAGRPVAPAVLYSDGRGAGLSRYDASWGAASLAWFEAKRPDVLGRAAHCTGAGGYLAGRLVGETTPIDSSQALKLGFDVHTGRWRDDLPVGDDRLPTVVEPDMPVGTISAKTVGKLGLRPGTTVLAGATDGVTGQLASAPAPNRWTTVLGSTLVWKGLADHPIDDASLGVYSHRGPEGTWFPGAAAMGGGRIVSDRFHEDDLDTLDRALGDRPPPVLVYPSVVTGERFPFADPAFHAFAEHHDDPVERYAACVTGVACLERWGYDVLTALTGAPLTAVATTGGATRAPGWLQRRSDVLGVPLVVPEESSSAFGAAIICASAAHGGILPAASAMVRWQTTIDPGDAGDDRWTHYFERFKARCLMESTRA